MNSIYSFRGKIKKGKKRGREMGFPTANVPIHKNIPEGVYISQLTLRNKAYNSLTFIGNAKTFGETEVLSETYILSFDDDIYGQWASIRLIKKIRSNEKFDSSNSLKKQMELDKKEAEKFFNTYV